MSIKGLREYKVYLIGVYKDTGDKAVRKEIRQLDKDIKRVLTKEGNRL